MHIDNGDGSKSGHGRRGYLQEGAWDAIHVVEVHIIRRLEAIFVETVSMC